MFQFSLLKTYTILTFTAFQTRITKRTSTRQKKMFILGFHLPKLTSMLNIQKEEHLLHTCIIFKSGPTRTSCENDETVKEVDK